MKEFWDERYAHEEFAYGEEPNEYFKEKLSKLKPGRILLPAEGEGRNAVYAAKLGWEVDAFDISKEGKSKAEQLAEKHNVSINYQVGALEDLNYESETFDVVGLIFTHFNPEIRAKYHKTFVGLLKTGGKIISETFSKNHIKYNVENPKVGGPKDVDFLTSIDQIHDEFIEIKVLELKTTEKELDEGIFHVGKGEVIRFFGEK